MLDYIKKVDFKNKEELNKIYETDDLIPVSLLINDTYFEIQNNTLNSENVWNDFLKIFYYIALKDENIKAIIDKYTDYNMFNNLLIFSKYQTSFGERSIKIAKDKYLRRLNKNHNNLKVIKKILKLSNVASNISIYVSSMNDIKNPNFKKEKNNLKKEILKRNKTRKQKIKTKSVGHYIAHINSVILTDYEKFIYDFNKRFIKSTFLGDIKLNDHEEEILNQFMIYEMQKFSRESKVDEEKLFCYGLVRFAMKYYGKSGSRFWPYAKSEYKLDNNLTVIQQGILNDLFRETMDKNGKKYYSGEEDKKGNKKIDNISMHCFITDNFANQLFDYLFDFWKLDLGRNSDNLTNENGQCNIDNLISEMTKNNSDDENATAGVKRHTAMAIASNIRGCKLRLRNIIYKIDDCFWNQSTTIASSNRIFKLLENWMNNKSSLFQEEYKINKKLSKYKKGERLLSKPTIYFDYNGDFKLKLPRQALSEVNEYDDIYWIIKIGQKVNKIKPDILCGKIREYTNEIIFDLNDTDIFDKITCEMWHNNKNYASFTIREDDIRFISIDKHFIENYEKGIASGNYYVFTKNAIVPQLLNAKVETLKIKNIYATNYILEDGDVLIFPNDIAIKIGQKLELGLTGVKPLKGVNAMLDGESILVYNKAPNIIFKADEKQLNGTSLIINNKIHHITDYELRKVLICEELQFVYAYMIDLSKLKLIDDVYNLIIELPNKKIKYNYNFIYINNFVYNFNNAPYIFKDKGTIEFSNVFNVICEEFEVIGNYNRYDFSFDLKNQNQLDTRVIDNQIWFEYQFLHNKIKLYFDIPALYWKYKLEDSWNVKQPSYISRKKIPNKLFLMGPMDLSSTIIKLDVENFYDDTLINYEKCIDKKIYQYELGKIQSWIEEKYDCDYLDIKLVNHNGESLLFTKLICRSIVHKSQIYGDLSEHIIYGIFDIEGDSSYSVAIKQDGEVIESDIPLINGEFQCESDFKEGIYDVFLYEIVEDDSGFGDPYTILLKTYSLKIIDQNDLSRYNIKLIDVRDTEGLYRPLKLKKQYLINNLKKVEKDIVDDIDLIWLDKLDTRNEEDMNKCKFYKGVLINRINNNDYYCFDVLLVFYDKYNISKYYLLGWNEDAYYDIYYNNTTHELLNKLDNSYKNRKIFIDNLFLTDYQFKSIMEDK